MDGGLFDALHCIVLVPVSMSHTREDLAQITLGGGWWLYSRRSVYRVNFADVIILDDTKFNHLNLA